MHGAGNDFMLLDLRTAAAQADGSFPDPARVREWSDRHTGIGFDQLLVLHDDSRTDVAARVDIWNADGSRAEQCGNGMRAVGRFLANTSPTADGRYTVAAPVADIALQTLDDGQVSVAMGETVFDPATAPFTGQAAGADGWYELALDADTVRFGVVSLGNPHAVIEVENIDQAPLSTIGMALRAHAAFPASCNVGFAQVIDGENIRLRVLERGAGETLACGSGACAAAAWLGRLGRVGDRVRVAQGGGTLVVDTDRGAGPVTLTGPAVHVFEGMIE